MVCGCVRVPSTTEWNHANHLITISESIIPPLNLPVFWYCFAKIRTKFDAHHIKLKQGDEIYLFSDGITDQFGGANNRKFSIKRLRAMIEKQGHENMLDMGEFMTTSFDNWKGDRKQTDDVLMIGIKF